MGGYGSGRQIRFARKTDEMQSIDISDLNRWGTLTAGRSGTLYWSNNGRDKTEVGYQSTSDAFILKYRYRLQDGHWHDVREVFNFTYTRQHIGGQRRWFLCPGCKQRCRIIFGGKYFRCRKCHGLVYDSQYHRFPSGNTNQLQKVRRRLDGSANLLEPFPPKPKGMHNKTYERLKWADMQSYKILERGLKCF